MSLEVWVSFTARSIRLRGSRESTVRAISVNAGYQCQPKRHRAPCYGALRCTSRQQRMSIRLHEPGSHVALAVLPENVADGIAIEIAGRQNIPSRGRALVHRAGDVIVAHQ